MTGPLIHRWDVARLRLHEAGGLVGVAGLARLWGVTQRRVHQLVRLEDFPQPVPRADAGDRAWILEEVQDWKRQRDERYEKYGRST